MRLSEIARAWEETSRTRARLEKVDKIAACLRAAGPAEIRTTVAYLSGELPQGSIGVGWATLRDLPQAAPTPTLDVRDVDAAFGRIAAAAGRGSQAARRAEVVELFGRATELEQRFLLGLLSGGLRQGALQGVMTDAVARASRVPVAEIRRAAMVAGDLGAVAAAVVDRGTQGLEGFAMKVMRPVQPMLAQSAPDVAAALARHRLAAVEWKLDGARLQLHKSHEEVRAFTRNLADVTARVPEVVDAVGSIAADEAVVDGEVIALDEHARPHPFQVTMGRFGSRLEVARHQALLPLSLFLFDCLLVDGDDLTTRPASERFAALARRAPPEVLVPRIVAEDDAAAESFLDDALRRGHEGVMVKDLGAPYEAGRRGAAWLKVKRALTLDLVVLAAEWGHGRRSGWLSNLHLGARDPRTGDLVMLGKTFKGMTDEMLEWQTRRLLALETEREGITVFVRPELVVEVAFDGLQSSARYPGGLALRFARVKGYRHDKRLEDADSIDAVRALGGAPDASG